MGDEEITIGFFPCSFSLGETIPHIKIANIFKKKGFNVIFFSRGGKFEKNYLFSEALILQLFM